MSRAHFWVNSVNQALPFNKVGGARAVALLLTRNGTPSQAMTLVPVEEVQHGEA